MVRSNRNKKGQGIAVNIVVMMILGIIIFAIGLGLFSKISKSGEDKIDELNQKIKTGITELECDGEELICAPSYELKNGKSGTFYLYITNREEQNKKFKIKFNDFETSTGTIASSNCGEIKINYLKDKNFNIPSEESAKIPFIAIATKVKKIPCSFIIPVTLLGEDNTELDKTTVIIKII